MNNVFIANWKMYLSYNETITWINQHIISLQDISDNNTICICPSPENLAPVASLSKKSSLSFGSQICSAYQKGAYTGQIAASSLAQLGCTFCLVGHSEERQYFKTTESDIAQKIQQLLLHKISPILCIGETLAEYNKGRQYTIDVLNNQITGLVSILKGQKESVTIYLAYEPIWAIGTDKTASAEHIHFVFDSLDHSLQIFKNTHQIIFLYGGSVDSKNCLLLIKNTPILGFLLGRASTDFQELKKIVSLF